ncbi:MAG TPA: DUF456 family protein [Bacillota bacterium]|nr:DUF456 family protein [Bacillota bacterium]
MVQLLLWLIVIACFIISFISLVYPIIPGVVFIWIGFFIYHFLIENDQLTMLFWLSAFVLTAMIIVSDIVMNSYFVKKFGGTIWGERAAAISVIVGSFVFPPLGIIILPMVVVIIVEIIQNKSTKDAVLTSVGSLIGFLSSTFAKFILLLAMILIFILFLII